jgi:hypothetical protein
MHEGLYGVWDLGGTPIEVTEGDLGPQFRLPGTPPGFAPLLDSTDDPGRFVLRGGSFDGAVVAIDDGVVSVGPFALTAVEGPYEEPPGYGLVAPEFIPDVTRDEVFASLAARMGAGASVEWTVPYPKHEFIRWLGSLDRYIFHGSNDRAIDEFLPVRTSMELYDHGGRGNLGAVYGTHDGLWSMFFAIVDRSRIPGSIRNGVTTFEAPDGRTVDSYQFSLDREALPERPFTTGALYVLPRATFTRLPMWPGGPLSNEWASVETVKPLARLTIAPEEFPFIDSIGAHDDGPMLRTFELTRRLITSGSAAKEVDDGYSVALVWNDELAAVYEEWLEGWSNMMPGVASELEGSGDQRTWTLRGPDAFRSTARVWLGDLLDD